jgi:hypothetical protein
MGKFASAKCQGAADTKLQEAYNRLIDLLDRGQVFESLVNGHKVRIVLDASGGFAGFIDGIQMFGLDPVTGQYKIKAYEDLIASLGDLAFLDVVETDVLGTTVFDGTYINTSIIDTASIIAAGKNVYIQDTEPTVTQSSIWLETLAGAPKSLWLVTP